MKHVNFMFTRGFATLTKTWASSDSSSCNVLEHGGRNTPLLSELAMLSSLGLLCSFHGMSDGLCALLNVSTLFLQCLLESRVKAEQGLHPCELRFHDGQSLLENLGLQALFGLVVVAQVLHRSLICQGAIVAESLQVALLVGVKRLHFGTPDFMIPSIDSNLCAHSSN